jgi:uncharacterized protein with PIN domain
MEKKKRKRRKPNKHRIFLDKHRHKYDQILEMQGGTCALCPRKPNPNRRLDLDHHHGDMRIRGLLCVVCNRALREFMDREWLLRAADYVQNDYGMDE